MPQFMLLLHNAPRDTSKASPADMQAVVNEYSAWSQKLAAAGKLKGGQKLADEGGRMITAKGGKISVTDGPYTETKEVVGGFFMIEAKSYDDAVKLSSDCPHLKFGGRIELRQIDVM
ncbi:MAG TPA: YciI family protein [Alphaproteobacteria bacterium]